MTSHCLYIKFYLKHRNLEHKYVKLYNKHRKLNTLRDLSLEEIFKNDDLYLFKAGHGFKVMHSNNVTTISILFELLDSLEIYDKLKIQTY